MTTPTTGREFIVVCYMRIEPEDTEPLAFEEAQKEMTNLELMQPENIYLIEPYEEKYQQSHNQG